MSAGREILSRIFVSFWKKGRCQRMQQDWMEEDKRPEEQFSGKERWLTALGAMKAALLIGLAYLAGFGLLIGLMLLIWK